MSAELGRKRVSQTDPLQQAPQGRALCGLGTAATLFTGSPCRLPVTAVRRGEVRCDLRQSELAVRKKQESFDGRGSPVPVGRAAEELCRGEAMSSRCF